MGGLAEADVGDLRLRAGGRAPGEVHPDDAVAGLVGAEPAVQLASQVAALALVSTIAKRQNSLPVQATTPFERSRVGRVLDQQRLGQQRADPPVGHAAEDQVLVGGQPQPAVAILAGQGGRFDQVHPDMRPTVTLRPT